MKILVTGATGLVGTNLVNKLKELGHDLYTASRRENIDLNDAEFTNKFFNLVKPDIVYHLAANAAESRGQISPIDMTQNNIGIFVNTLRAAINVKVKKFIYTSSVAVYGQVETPYKEDDLTKPCEIYGINKLACEQILKVMAHVYGFEYTIFRPHNIYGPHQNMADPYRNVVALIMRRLIEDQPYKLFGEGTMRRAFSYVDDVVEVLVQSLDDRFDGKTVNVGSASDVSIKELSDLLQEVTEKTSEVEMAPARKQEISMFVADHALQDSLLEYAETPLAVGLKKTWDWVLSQPLPEVLKREDEIHV